MHRPRSEPWLELADIEVVPRGPAPQCPACQRYCGLMVWQPPFVARIEGRGSRWPDVGFGGGNEVAVSERLCRAVIHNSLRGLTLCGALAIEGVQWSGARPKDGMPTYQVASVTYSRDAVDDARSRLVREDGPPCPMCRLAGVIISWDGLWMESESESATLDFFFARGLPGTLWLSARAKALWDELDAQGAELSPASEYRSDAG